MILAWDGFRYIPSTQQMPLEIRGIMQNADHRYHVLLRGAAVDNEMARPVHQAKRSPCPATLKLR
jgi:hypothetical protein